MRVFLLALIIGCATAAVSQAVPPTEAVKPPIEFGFEHRVRYENFDDTQDFNDATDDLRSHLRFRTKMWTEVHATPNVNFFVRLDNEFRKTFDPKTDLSRTAPDETIIDSLYLELRNLSGFSARIGRQDINKGEGFVLSEGTSGDGSRSWYFNAVTLEYAWRKSKVEIIGALQPHTERMLPVVNDRDKLLNESDESLLGAYYTNNESKSTDLEAYYLYKKETRDTRSATSIAFLPDRHVHTAGGRIARRVNGGWKAAGEFAYQWGAQRANVAKALPAASIRAFGGYGYVRKNFEQSTTKPFLVGGYWLMSGDDNSTADRYEGWDPVFSRQPLRSDLYVYAFAKERGAAYWTNFRMPFIQGGFTPWKPLTVTASLYYADAFKPYTAGPAGVFGQGTHRGELATLKGEFKFNENWKGHVQYERLHAGSFYARHASPHFFRMEVLYSWKSSDTSIKAQ